LRPGFNDYEKASFCKFAPSLLRGVAGRHQADAEVEIDNIHQRHTTDVYEHALTITAWQQIYDQLHPGQFRGEFTEILLDEIQVFREYTGLALRQSCLVWPNSFWFGIPATRGEQGFIGSQCLGRAEIATRPGGTEFELSTPDDYTILGVVISEEVISRQASFLHHPERVLHMLRNQSALAVKEPHKAALWGLCSRRWPPLASIRIPFISRRCVRSCGIICCWRWGRCWKRRSRWLPPRASATRATAACWRRRANMCWKTARSR
jgi:hypothetical protein